MMTKLLIGLLGAGVIATGGYAAASGLDAADPARTVSLPAATSTEDTTTGTTSTGTTTAGDVSGPCDEAEHRNDPRCTGSAAAGGGDDDRSGSDKGSDDDENNDDDNDDEDRSGSNSGQG